jgi:hypothetical protein
VQQETEGRIAVGFGHTMLPGDYRTRAMVEAEEAANAGSRAQRVVELSGLTPEKSPRANAAVRRRQTRSGQSPPPVFMDFCAFRLLFLLARPDLLG